MCPARSCPEWEQVGTSEWNPADHWDSGTTTAPRPPAVSSNPLSQQQDPQPFNPAYQLQTGILDWINIRALGARGDGVTDDTGIFQAANLIAQLPPGRMIYIPAGTYKLTSSIVFSGGVSWLNMGTVTGGTLSGGTQIQFGAGGGGMINPMTGVGQMIVAGVGGSPSQLSPGAQGSLLHVGQSLTPYWLKTVANVVDFGADPTGAVDSTSAFTAAYNSLPLTGSPGQGGIVYAPAGTYKITSTLTFNAVAPVYLIGDGMQATTLMYSGTGDCVRMFDNYTPTGGEQSIKVWGGGVSELTIDGTSASGTGVQCGLHIGDMKQKIFSHVRVQNFASTSPVGVGVWIDNTLFWTEDCHGAFSIGNCQQAVVFDVGSSFSGSVSGSGTVDIDNNQWEFNMGGAGTGQNGVLVTGGVFIYHSRIWQHGGLRSSATTHTHWAALQVGSNFGANDGSEIFHTELIIQMESDGAGANTPQTIIQAHSGNNITGCWGYMNFMSGYTAGSTPAQFAFMGPIHGDVTPFPLTSPSMSGLPASGSQMTNNGPRTLVLITSTGSGGSVVLDGTTLGVAVPYLLEVETGHQWGLGTYTGSPSVQYISAVPGN